MTAKHVTHWINGQQRDLVNLAEEQVQKGTIEDSNSENPQPSLPAVGYHYFAHLNAEAENLVQYGQFVTVEVAQHVADGVALIRLADSPQGSRYSPSRRISSSRTRVTASGSGSWRVDSCGRSCAGSR